MRRYSIARQSPSGVATGIIPGGREMEQAGRGQMTDDQVSMTKQTPNSKLK
jgi:hypothetical protein